MLRRTPSRTAPDSTPGLVPACGLPVCGIGSLRWLAALLLVLFIAAKAASAQPGHAASHQPSRPAARPAESRPPGNPAPRGNRANATAGNASNPHLSQWMDNHQSLPLADQQRALESEPGFRQLPPNQQQRYRDLLTRLNAMPPEQRQRYLARTEAMEQLTPPQRQQVRGAMAQLGSLPEDRSRAVARIFRDVRTMPDAQRQAYLNSPQVRALNDQERGALDSLLRANAYIPLERPVQRPVAPPQ